jgi:hypothetical protein
MGRKYKNVNKQGVRFVFAYDDDAPELLHIYVRHLTTIDDALDTFFTGSPAKNDQYERYETFTDTHGLYWFWIEDEKVVMVISCFKV